MGVVVAIGNLWKERPGDEKMIRFMRRKSRRMAKRRDAEGALLKLTEFGRGKKSVRERPVGKTKKVSSKQRWRKITNFGAHNHVAIRDIEIDGVKVRSGTVHGLHRGSVGFSRQATYFVRLAAIVSVWTAKGVPWMLGGDFNRGIKWVARLLGGSAAGEGIDGIVVSHKLKARLIRVVRKPWSDHPIIFVHVKVKKKWRKK